MAKKTFKGINPAEAFITKKDTSTVKETKTKDKKDINKELSEEEKERIAMEYLKNRETKSKRVNILVKPSTYDNLQEYAKENGTSMNDIINQAIKSFLSK